MSKEVTIYDIAKELKLSAATVSRGLKSSSNIKKSTTKRILDKAEELGYRHNNFASNLRKQKSHTIGVLLHELNSNFITSVLAGIENVTREAGYDIIIAHSGESYDKEIANVTNLFHKRVDGLIASLAFGTKNLDHFNRVLLWREIELCLEEGIVQVKHVYLLGTALEALVGEVRGVEVREPSKETFLESDVSRVEDTAHVPFY